MKLSSKEIIEIGKHVIRIEKEAIADVEQRIGENFAKAIELILKSEGRVIVTGMGKSGAVGRKISSTLSSTGTTSLFLHPAEGVHGDLGMVIKNDVVIAISKSGETSEILNLLPSFKRLNIPIIALTSNRESTLGRYAEVILDISVKEEACPNDLAPTASTTVTLAIGDAIAVALLKNRGFSVEDFALLHPAGILGRKLILKVSDLMENGELLPYCLESDVMRSAIMQMAHKRGICPVVDKNFFLKGVVTTGDLNRLIEKTESVFKIPVKEVMTRNPKFVYEDDLATMALDMMQGHEIISLPVLNREKKLSGVIHMHDILQQGLAT
ncbi:MAG: KpsF/GutQ family sugar-phosphate isomerase [Calditrichaceae bacterium]|nr:KpsF/GutQ family sugar-phosphate isomerase [Calditrichaceae bacterium]MBN2710076.1 KpsF/GutQ family sugar-phosphate isomerase [Calditrichaceae bacterium]RQV94508.1 MAG: KpsF/GutQ family sugar-phosphate isomerase [Calditrichota bacterium]